MIECAVASVNYIELLKYGLLFCAGLPITLIGAWIFGGVRGHD